LKKGGSQGWSLSPHHSNPQPLDVLTSKTLLILVEIKHKRSCAIAHCTPTWNVKVNRVKKQIKQTIQLTLTLRSAVYSKKKLLHRGVIIALDPNPRDPYHRSQPYQALPFLSSTNCYAIWFRKM